MRAMALIRPGSGMVDAIEVALPEPGPHEGSRPRPRLRRLPH